MRSASEVRASVSPTSLRLASGSQRLSSSRHDPLATGWRTALAFDLLFERFKPSFNSHNSSSTPATAALQGTVCQCAAPMAAHPDKHLAAPSRQWPPAHSHATANQAPPRTNRTTVGAQQLLRFNACARHHGAHALLTPQRRARVLFAHLPVSAECVTVRLVWRVIWVARGGGACGGAGRPGRSVGGQHRTDAGSGLAACRSASYSWPLVRTSTQGHHPSRGLPERSSSVRNLDTLIES
jgi:hypothetical protein